MIPRELTGPSLLSGVSRETCKELTPTLTVRKRRDAMRAAVTNKPRLQWLNTTDVSFGQVQVNPIRENLSS